ncbi:MAG: outer membrane protein transport protein [Candidatus Aminicenantes bacterium]
MSGDSLSPPASSPASYPANTPAPYPTPSPTSSPTLFIRLSIAILFLIIPLLALPSSGWAQVVIGQYVDEAPVRTWNNIGVLTGPALGMGETQFTLARDSSVALTNPALLSRLPKFSVSLSGSAMRATLQKYSLINTGAVTTRGTPDVGIFALDYAGASFRLKRFTFALSIALLEYYYRPGVRVDSEFEGNLYHRLVFNQDGALGTINLAVAYRINDRLSVGIGANFVGGDLDKSVDERYYVSEITQEDKDSSEYTGFYVNGGVVYDVSDRLTVAAMVRTPYTKKAVSESLIRYESNYVEVKTEAKADDNTYKQPLVAGMGVKYKLSDRLLVASDLTYFDWSSYAVTYFEEELDRDFRDIVKVSTGGEFWGAFQLFGKEWRYPLRIGFTYDPQPMKDPNIHYLYLSVGMGLEVGRFALDVSSMFGKEYGSGDSLNAQKVVLTLSYRINK